MGGEVCSGEKSVGNKREGDGARERIRAATQREGGYHQRRVWTRREGVQNQLRKGWNQG